MAIRKDGIKVNRENSDIYRKLILAPTFLFLVEKYKFELFLNTISKNAISRTISKVNRCNFPCLCVNWYWVLFRKKKP